MRMEQLHNSMMAMLQHTVMQQESAPVKTEDKNEGTSFRDLLAEKKEPADCTNVEAADRKTEMPSRETDPQTEETADVEQQLLAATLSAMRVPVVQVQQMPQPDGTQNVAVPVTAVTEQAAVQVLGDAHTEIHPEGKQQLNLGVEETRMTEELQTIQTHQAAEGKTADTDLTEQGMKDAVRVLNDADKVQEENGGEAPVFHEVKDILVKVGEAAETQPAEELEVPVKDQVGQKISEALDRGEMRLSVRLNPGNLGQVDVKLTLTQDGALQVELRAENPQTQQLLEKESMGLQHMLMRSTQQEVQIQVARQQESQQQAFEDGRQGSHHQNPQQERREERHSAEDFLQQLRLGLIPVEAEAS